MRIFYIFYFSFILTTIFSYGQINKPIQVNFLNNYNKDSLKIITSDDFVLKDYANYSYDKNKFLDTFLLNSEAINGKFKIIKTISDTEPKIYSVQDISDYYVYLKLNPLTWKMTITTEKGKIKKVKCDTLTGFKKYLEDFVPKHDKFIKWLTKEHPDETENKLFVDTCGLFATRLKEYLNYKP